MMDQREASGKSIWRSVPVILNVAAAFLLASALYAGKNPANKPKPTELPAEVIAHLPLSSPPGNQMVLQALGDKHYLYIQQAGKQGFMIVNVTKPEFPSLVDRQAKSGDGTAGTLRIVGGDLGVAEVPDRTVKGSIASSSSPTETVRILDLSDPAHPKTLQTFNNVTSLLGDAGRGIIYLANDQGLWVLKHHHSPITPAKQKRPCTSEDALAAMPPDCQ